MFVHINVDDRHRFSEGQPPSSVGTHVSFRRRALSCTPGIIEDARSVRFVQLANPGVDYLLPLFRDPADTHDVFVCTSATRAMRVARV